MKLPEKLGTRLRLALVGTAVFSILAFTAAILPVLFGSVREDRVNLFVEKSTRALSETLSHYLDQYSGRVQETATSLALLHGTQSGELRVINQAVHESVPGLLRQGAFDLMVVVGRDGLIHYANTVDRMGDPLNSTELWGHHISEFREEEKAFLGSFAGLGKQDWYRSKMVERVAPGGRSGDVCRLYSVAWAAPIPNSDRVLIGILNWEAVQRVLDNIEPQLARVGFPSAFTFMLARDADTLIAHKFRDPQKVNDYGLRALEDLRLPGLVRAVQEGRSSHRHEYPPGTRVIAGLSRIDDADFAWTVGLGISDRDVVAPGYSLAWRLGLLGAGVVVLALFLSKFLTQRVTLGLGELMQSALRIAEGRFDERVPVRSRDEIGQLARAFNTMSGALAERDDVIRYQQDRLLERTRLDQELSIAAQVQQRLLPQLQPQLSTLDYAGVCLPARGVSGDYFDFLPIAPGKLGLIVADVSGKGLSAALLMASLHASVRTHAPLLAGRPDELIAEVNHLLYEATDSTRYATMFYAVYDDAARLLTYVNAGHNPPVLVRPGAAMCRALEATSMPVGLFLEFSVARQNVPLASGDWLLAYSDGLSEAVNNAGEEFGDARPVEIVRQNPGLAASAMLDAILAAVRAHVGARHLADDLTLIVARVL